MKQSASILKLLFFLAFLSYSFQAMAQFTVTEDFRGAGGPDIIIGDNAYLTSGVDDPVGAGWLRLTKDANNQKGYAYINRSFPSTQGVLVDFEYVMWRETEFSFKGADGISVFLFDAAYGPGNFALGAYGGSLGYANNIQNVSDGLTGGYIGIGLDAYGNYAAESEGKIGGSSGLSPNSVVLRGKTTNNDNTTNKYLEGVTITGVTSSGIELDEDAKNMNGISTFDGIDYNSLTITRPDISTFYRRVQIEILPLNSGDYEITIRMSSEFGGAFTDLITYTTTTPPPSLLKLGFAASTGGGINNHEIRNLKITTLGNLRVNKNANIDILRSKPSTDITKPSNKITYNIEVTNDTPADLNNIAFNDRMTDGNANPIPEGLFEIESITTEGFLPGTTLPEPTQADPILNGEITGLLKLAAKSIGKIQVKGKLKDTPRRNILTNTVNVNDINITDTDLSNNTSSVSTPVVSEKSDLVVQSMVDETCLNDSSGNTFTLKVRNAGLLDLNYGQQTGNKLTLTTTLPAGATLSNTSISGWSMTQSGNIITFTKEGTGTLSLNEFLPTVTYMVSTTTEYSHQVEVASLSEDPDNTDNNDDSNNIAPQPDKPTMNDDTITYSQYAEASPLSATADAGNILLWSLSDGGVTSTTPYTPNTNEAGTTEYWVAQKTPDGCRSDFKKITVDVNAAADIDPGEIGSSQTICPDTQPDMLTSVNDGDAVSQSSLGYIWQKSTDNGQTWTTISGETSATFQPVAVSEITLFRRGTTNNNGDLYPTDPVTIFMATSGNCNISLCTADIEGESFSWDYPSGTPSPVTETIVQPASNAGFVFDIYELDNSFNMEINGTKLAVDEIEFQSNGTSGINIRFADGNQYVTNTQGNIWEMEGEPGKPLIRVKILPSGEIEMFGSKVSSSNSNYQLEPLEFIPSEGNSFNTIYWNTTGANTIVVTQNVQGATLMNGYGSGKSLAPCDPYQLSKEGVFNDENNNNSTQPNETITYTLTLENNGDIDIYEPELSDPMFGGLITETPIGDVNNDGVLNITETWVYTIEHNVTQSEIDAGGVYNQAKVTGKTVEGYVLDSVYSTDPTPLDSGNEFYDSDRPDHTFVRLPPPIVITNPMLPSKAQKN